MEKNLTTSNYHPDKQNRAQEAIEDSYFTGQEFENFMCFNNGKNYCTHLRILKSSLLNQMQSEVNPNCVYDSCQPSCLLRKEFTSFSPLKKRILVQIKCIEQFKWIESEREGRDIGWNEAGVRWAEEGYAKEFAKIYAARTPLFEIFPRIMAAKGKVYEPRIF